MSYVAKRVLLLTKDVDFAAKARRALERHGSFEVVTFTRGSTAVDHVRSSALDAAVIDFRLTDMPGTDVIDHLRVMQPHIAVIAAPNHPAVVRLKDKHNIQAIIDIPLPLRKLLEILRTAMQDMYESQPDTRTGPPLQEGDTVPLQIQSDRVEFWVADQSGGGAIIQIPRDEPSRPLSGSEAFQKLMEEEPPMPPLMEGSTIRDLRLALSREENMRRVVEALDDPDAGLPTDPIPVEDSGSTPAKLILETTFDQSTPINEFSATQFLQTVQDRASVQKGAILPLPSWLAESERYIREPEFLPEDLLSLSQPIPLEYTATPTSPGDAIVEDGEDLVTDQIEPVRRSHPAPPTLPEVDQVDAEEAEETPETGGLQRPPSLPEFAPEVPTGMPDIARLAQMSGEAQTPQAAVTAQDDPQMAQLALALTQVSLELATDAILLAQGDELIAYAGDLPEEDIDELRLQVQGDWRADPQGARMRFFTLSSSGKDYLLYTCRTEADYALTMIFDGDMPLSTIQRQSARLREALDAIQQEATSDQMDEAPAVEPAPAVAQDDFTAHSLVWLLDDPDADAFTPPLARHLTRTLEQEVLRRGWRMLALHVQEDYMNLLAQVPDSVDVRQAIRELMTFTAEVVHDFDPDLEPIGLWDDSYLIQRGDTPLDVLEIQDFVNFVRG